MKAAMRYSYPLLYHEQAREQGPAPPFAGVLSWLNTICAGPLQSLGTRNEAGRWLEDTGTERALPADFP